MARWAVESSFCETECGRAVVSDQLDGWLSVRPGREVAESPTYVRTSSTPLLSVFDSYRFSLPLRQIFSVIFFPSPNSWRDGRGRPHVRASDEASASLHLTLGEWSRLPFTARIERAHSYRARSASKKGTWPLPSIFLSVRDGRARR